jgi:hypothetical protein
MTSLVTIARAVLPLWTLRVFGVLLSALLVAGQLAVLGHLALVEHAICAKHGEVVHAESATGPAVDAGQHVAAWTGTSGESSHEHCECLGRAPDPFGLPAPWVTADVAAPPAERALPCGALDLPVRQLPALALAPKQSPPLG